MRTDLVSLQKQASRTLHLPKRAQQVVDGYLNITVEGVRAACPYHINPGFRSTDRALIGKGAPQEITVAATKYFKRYEMHPNGDPETLRTFLSACGIGIDCSGFAAWVLNGITESKLDKPIWKCLEFSGLRRTLISTVRPIENISASLLTGHINALTLNDLSDIKPGDLLRLAGWHHVVVVTDVGLDAKGKALYFQYAQSSCMYHEASGVRTGYAIIEKPLEHLRKQRWFDGYTKNPIEYLIAEGGNESRAVRLKALAR